RQDKKILLDSLFELCSWHAHAKLRLHTDNTLEIFEASTSSLGAILCKFKQEVCSSYDTKEIPPETAA
ncbi:hypothetical protein CONPUDRAFT_65425, partial [Coniophora puteana RWD-64-598 SS2]